MKRIICNVLLLTSVGIISVSSMAEENKTVSIYGSFRPVLNATTQGDDTTVDVADGLSRFGLKGQTTIEGVGKAFFKGEWSVPIQDSAQLEKSRLAFAGLNTDYGTITIGKQRPVHYSMIAEYADIFNHAASPYAYDYSGSPFYADNAVKYQVNVSGVEFQALSRNSGTNKESLYDVGLGYRITSDNFDIYAAVSSLKQSYDETVLANTDTAKTARNSLAVAANIADLYIAVAAQKIVNENKLEAETKVDTLDVSSSYQLPSNYKVKLGWFSYGDDIKTSLSEDHSGYNLTLENQLADNVRVHVEYLVKDFSEQDDAIQAVNFGLRYDFSTDL